MTISSGIPTSRHLETTAGLQKAVDDASSALIDLNSILKDVSRYNLDDSLDCGVIVLLRLQDKIEAAEGNYNRALAALAAVETASKKQFKFKNESSKTQESSTQAVKQLGDLKRETTVVKTASKKQFKCKNKSSKTQESSTQAVKQLEDLVKERRGKLPFSAPLGDCQILNSKNTEEEIVAHFVGDLKRETTVLVKINGEQFQVPADEEPIQHLKLRGLTHQQAMLICKYAHQGLYLQALDHWNSLDDKAVFAQETPSSPRVIEANIDETGNISIETKGYYTLRNPDTVYLTDIPHPQIILNSKLSSSSETLETKDVTEIERLAPLASPESNSGLELPSSPSTGETESTGSTKVPMQPAAEEGSTATSRSNSPSSEKGYTGSTGSTQTEIADS